MAKRQAEILRDNVEESGKVAQKLAGTKPEERLGVQTKLAQTAFDKAVADYRELTDLAVQSQSATIDKISSLVGNNFEELRQTKPAAKP